MLNIFRTKTLEDRLSETSRVKVCGVIFDIQRFNPLNYLDGSKVLKQTYDTYAIGGKEPDEASMKKIQSYYTDVFMASIIKPVLSRKDVGEGVFVGELFRDWDLANSLYEAIMNYTYGKKKVKRLN